MRRGHRWSHSGDHPRTIAAEASVVPQRRGPLTCAAGASVVPKLKTPRRPGGRSLGGSKMEEGPVPMQWGPPWSQSREGPRAHAAGPSVVP